MFHADEFEAKASRRDLLRIVGTAMGTSLIAQGVSQAGGTDAQTPFQWPNRKASPANRGVVPPDKTYRMMELSLHIPPEGKFEINLEGVVTSARDAGAESLMFYSQDHGGTPRIRATSACAIPI
jgi:hypothetical protein